MDHLRGTVRVMGMMAQILKYLTEWNVNCNQSGLAIYQSVKDLNLLISLQNYVYTQCKKDETNKTIRFR